MRISQTLPPPPSLVPTAATYSAPSRSKSPSSRAHRYPADPTLKRLAPARRLVKSRPLPLARRNHLSKKPPGWETWSENEAAVGSHMTDADVDVGAGVGDRSGAEVLSQRDELGHLAAVALMVGSALMLSQRKLVTVAAWAGIERFSQGPELAFGPAPVERFRDGVVVTLPKNSAMLVAFRRKGVRPGEGKPLYISELLRCPLAVVFQGMGMAADMLPLEDVVTVIRVVAFSTYTTVVFEKRAFVRDSLAVVRDGIRTPVDKTAVVPREGVEVRVRCWIEIVSVTVELEGAGGGRLLMPCLREACVLVSPSIKVQLIGYGGVPVLFAYAVVVIVRVVMSMAAVVVSRETLIQEHVGTLVPPGGHIKDSLEVNSALRSLEVPPLPSLSDVTYSVHRLVSGLPSTVVPPLPSVAL